MKRLLALTLALLLLLTGCGASAGSNYKTEAAAPAAMNSSMGAPMEYAEEAVAMDSAAALTEGGAEPSSTALPQERKWIVTVYMDAEAEDLDTAITGIDAHITQMGGYVENQSIYNGSAYANRRYRNANLTVRIPAERVDEFTEEVAGIANVVSKEKSLEDITLTYTATESRMKALQAEEARLLELLAEAETMADLLEIEARLTDVRYELETVTSQLRLYNNQVDFATIHLSLREVQEYTPVEDPTIWERITGGFKDSLEGVGEGFVDAFVWLIVCSPYIAVFAVFAAIAFVLFKKLPRRKKKTKE
ncbi:MAG: DUF4349 domain-containing protein [Oscillospiraceae bacterium]|nr:DUF4349 domain-containing protein [Oscillospiraceae bacterium]